MTTQWLCEDNTLDASHGLYKEENCSVRRAIVAEWSTLLFCFAVCDCDVAGSSLDEVISLVLYVVEFLIY